MSQNEMNSPASAPLPDPDAESIRTLLHQVIDPEVGINIVDLGLIYGIEASPGRVIVTMTMTSPACPMGEMIKDEIDAVLTAVLPHETAVEVRIVWDPPWTRERMSPQAREHFGW